MPGARLLQAYRRTGADLPFGDRSRAHGVAFEGYYWRITDAVAGRVAIALCGVSRGPGDLWALVALAAEPGGLVRHAVVQSGVRADPERFGVHAGTALVGDGRRLRVDLGPGARLDVELAAPAGAPRRTFGALGAAHALPGLPQYWDPLLLGVGARGRAELGEERVAFTTAATAYVEKNWGPRFSEHWWWGQAQDFEGADACVAFAGGRIELAGLAAAPSAVVLRLEGEVLRVAPPVARMTAAVGEGGWRIHARSARHELVLEGHADGGAPAVLPVPVAGERRVELRSRQHLAGRLHVRVRRGRRLLFTGESALAGLEHGTPLSDPPPAARQG